MLLIMIPARSGFALPALVPPLVRQQCPVMGLQEGGERGFSASGIILTAFDWRATWHFDVASGRRFPIPETAPCGRNCRLSPDGTELSYFNDATNAHNIMRLDGANRVFVATNAIDVQWWDEYTLFAWTPGVSAFILRNGEQESFDADNLISVQPGGAWGLRVDFDGERFNRSLVDLRSDSEDILELGEDIPYYNNFAWSPDRRMLAFVQPIPISEGVYASELFLLDLETLALHQATQLQIAYGVTRINGIAVNDLAWSPDSRRLAFWVTPDSAAGDSPAEVQAVVHLLDARTDELTAYCGFSTTTHTPNPPHLVWSPEGDALAFADDIVDDGRGAFLIGLSVESGRYAILSEGIYAAYGSPDVYLWGSKP